MVPSWNFRTIKIQTEGKRAIVFHRVVVSRKSIRTLMEGTKPVVVERFLFENWVKSVLMALFATRAFPGNRGCDSEKS